LAAIAAISTVDEFMKSWIFHNVIFTHNFYSRNKINELHKITDSYATMTTKLH